MISASPLYRSPAACADIWRRLSASETACRLDWKHVSLLRGSAGLSAELTLKELMEVPDQHLSENRCLRIRCCAADPTDARSALIWDLATLLSEPILTLAYPRYVASSATT